MKKTIISSLAALFFVGLVIVILQNRRPSAPLSSLDLTSPQPGLVVDTPKVNALVSSPLIVSGYVEGKNSWGGFEGQAGTVKLVDSNGKFLAMDVLKATTDWTKRPTSFTASLNFAAPQTTNGALVFRNENPTGNPEFDREFRLLVKFKWDE
ncbi:MAG TPA: Gmad2 immunoglobulin-like domain-containing protein [Candidatus Udaeobacter sp.]|nr:Gmad2 immunoglobulin-like domain-containing protein [Candidatus Udaeobacter sp.]